jgi:conjugative transfer signal peptidase TraF
VLAKGNKKFFGMLCLSLFLLLAATVCLGLAGFRVNLTSSMPLGVYKLRGGEPQRGDYVYFCLESTNPFAQVARERGYLKKGSCPMGLQALLKKLSGLPNDVLKVDPSRGIWINDCFVPSSSIPTRDSKGWRIPESLLKNGAIPSGYGLVMSENSPNGFDSRHFGLIPLSSLKPVKTVFIKHGSVNTTA